MKLSIILPTYNEAENIGNLLDSLTHQLNGYDYQLLVIDDNSPDGTFTIAKSFADKTPRIQVIRRTSDKGLTASLNEGIKHAQMDYIGWMDCDFSHPPDLLPQMIQVLKKDIDVVIASRYVPGGGDQRLGQYSLQKYLSKILQIVTNIMTPIKVKDVSSGYILGKSSCFYAAGELQGDYGEYFIYLLNSLTLNNTSIVEIPYLCQNRTLGESKTATSISGYIKRGVKYLRAIYNCR